MHPWEDNNCRILIFSYAGFFMKKKKQDSKQGWNLKFPLNSFWFNLLCVSILFHARKQIYVTNFKKALKIHTEVSINVVFAAVLLTYSELLVTYLDLPRGCIRMTLETKYFMKYFSWNNWFFKFNQFPAGNYMFKLSNKNTRTRC